MRLLVGLDIGTSRIKAVVYPVTMEGLLYQTSCPTPVSHPGPGLSEHDPEALWHSVVGVLKDVSEQGLKGSITALSVSSMADTGIVLDEEDLPLYPIVAWYDQRCRQQVAWLSQHISASQFHFITGQRFSTSLGISKWMWLRENLPNLDIRKVTWLSVTDYIIYRLTKKKVTDYSIASRMGLFDQRSLSWSEPLLKIVGLPESSLPLARPSSTPIGEITSEARAQTGLPPGTLCVLGGHDHLCAAAAVDSGCPTTLVDSCGTAQSLLVGMETFKPDKKC